MATSYGPYNLSDFPGGSADSDALRKSVDDSSIAKNLVDLSQDIAAGNYLVWFDAALSAAEETTLHGDATPPAAGSLLGDHLGRTSPDRNSEPLATDPSFEAIEPGSSKVVANDRPAIECNTAVAAFAAASETWPQSVDALAKLKASLKFILKAAGTGSNVRIAVKAKSESVGDDSSAAFSLTGFAVVPITHTTVGEVFEGAVEIDASSFSLDDSVALQIGRDGNNALGAGTNDDVSVAIQIISVKVEAL